MEHPTPWRVYAAKLRPQFSAVIVEIQDANGETVIPWTGFDQMTHTKAKRIARRICKAANLAALPEPAPTK